MVNLITLGEALIDFVPTESGLALAEVPGFYKRFGGAPANVAIGLAKLGESVGFIGKVGADSFGDFLEEYFKSEGVDLKQLFRTDRANTTLAFVSLTEEGERDFIFYRDPGADELLGPEEIDEDYVGSADLLHFGSLSLTHRKSRQATLKSIEYAKRQGVIVTMDPNIRLNLWESKNQVKELVTDLAGDVDILKLSEEEVRFLTGTSNLKAGTDQLAELGPELIAVTMGEEGCFVNHRNMVNRIDGLQVEVKDTTGAGDGFMAGFLHKLSKAGLDLQGMSFESIVEALRFGNATGALTTTDFGATSSFPDKEKVKGTLEQIRDQE